MLSKTNSCAVIGLDGEIVEVEVDISNGTTAFNVVGLPEKPVQEARERVRAAIKNSGYRFSNQRITVNLAPADLRKEGPAYDLPIAVGILMASGQVPEPIGEEEFFGHVIKGDFPAPCRECRTPWLTDGGRYPRCPLVTWNGLTWR